MLGTVNEVAVLAVSFLALAVGSIWYSPFVFGKTWQRVAGLTDEHLSYTKRQFLLLLLIVLVSNVAIFSVIAHVLTVVPQSVLTPKELTFGLSVFVGAVLTSMVMWERRSFTYGFIHVGYAVLVIILGVNVLHYWPW